MDSFNLSLNLCAPRLIVESSRLRAFATSRIVADFQSKTDKSDESRCHRKSMLPPIASKYHMIKRTRVVQTRFLKQFGKLKKVKIKKNTLFLQTCSHRKELTYSGFQPPFVIPPVQIRTCAANASGSCFESDAQTLPFGAPCLNRSLILPASEFRTQEGKQNSSQPSPFAPQAPLISFALLLSTNDLIVRRFIATTNLSDFLKT